MATASLPSAMVPKPPLRLADDAAAATPAIAPAPRRRGPGTPPPAGRSGASGRRSRRPPRVGLRGGRRRTRRTRGSARRGGGTGRRRPPWRRQGRQPAGCGVARHVGAVLAVACQGSPSRPLLPLANVRSATAWSWLMRGRSDGSARSRVPGDVVDQGSPEHRGEARGHAPGSPSRLPDRVPAVVGVPSAERSELLVHDQGGVADEVAAGVLHGERASLELGPMPHVVLVRPAPRGRSRPPRRRSRSRRPRRCAAREEPDLVPRLPAKCSSCAMVPSPEPSSEAISRSGGRSGPRRWPAAREPARAVVGRP